MFCSFSRRRYTGACRKISIVVILGTAAIVGIVVARRIGFSMTSHSFKLDYVFAVPIAQIRMADPAPLTKRLAALFLEKEAEGDKYRDAKRRDTQHGELFESRFNLFNWGDAPVTELAHYCHAALNELLLNISDYEPQDLQQLKFEYHSWFHITRKGGFQGLHYHQNASWSGIFCVDPGDELEDKPHSGLVRFHDPRGASYYYEDAGNRRLKSPANHGTIDVIHEPGKLLLFPSYITHEIYPYEGERPRIVVAFNCWILGRGDKRRQQNNIS